MYTFERNGKNLYLRKVQEEAIENFLLLGAIWNADLICYHHNPKFQKSYQAIRVNYADTP